MNRFSLAMTMLALGASIAGAASQGLPASQPLPLRQWDTFDQILAAEAPLGSDAWHVQRLEQSPRAHEPVSIAGGPRTLQAFVVHPGGSGKVPVVLMAPEDQGLNAWARDMADQIAAMGYIVIVPDFLSGYGPAGAGRSSFPDIKSIMMAHSALPAHEESMTGDLNAWADYGKRLPQANGKLAAIGFAWGGGRVFWFATQRKDLSAAFVFYDTAPPASALRGLSAPVYGFYAANDPRVTKSLETTKSVMAAAGKAYEAMVYPGSDHMFVRLGEEPGNTNPANIEARAQALARLQDLLRGL